MSFEPLPFPRAAAQALGDPQLRANLRQATRTIRDKRAEVVGELPDWEALRDAGERIKREAIRHLDVHLEQLERAVTSAGGTVHWARDGNEAIEAVTGVARAHGSDEVIKVKSLATDEIGLNEGLADRGIEAVETDLAELIVQLDGDYPSHILVPAIHRNRAEIREIFRRRLGIDDLSDDPAELAEAARLHLRRKFRSVPVAVSGANFAVAETGAVCVVESEGNGRMCTTLPRALVTVVGIEKVLPRFRDLEVMLQLLPRSSTGERMNPYTSLWTGVTPGDGPQEFHLVLLDAGRIQTLADPIGRDALHCIRCSACLNVCPVYERTGGHAYRSVYPGPIGAVLTPQLNGLEDGASLPWASSLCGACYDACPVKIDIPSLLVHLRGRVVRERGGGERRGRDGGEPRGGEQRGRGKPPTGRAGGGLDAAKRRLDGEALAMRVLARTFTSRRRYEAAQRVGRAAQWPFVRRGRIERLPGPLAAWTKARDLRPVPDQSFRQWWRARGRTGDGSEAGPESGR